ATTLQQLTLNGTGKNITLGSPFNLSGTLTLNAGLLITTASNLLTLTAEASSTEGSAGSYVNGPVQKVGSTAFVFPLGKDGVWARLAISAPATPTAAFTAEYIAASHPVSATTSPLDNVSRIEYWNLTRSAGSDDVAVRLFWQDAIRSGIDEFSADLQVARYDGSTWLTEGNGSLGGSLAAGSVVSEGAVGGYGAFSFGSLSPQVNPLPVELLSFRAAATQPGSVQLSWATASETKNKGFGIERSPDGQTWQQVAFVAGRGTSTQQQQYTHLDVVKAANTTLYYRLRQQDVDGKATYSQVAAIRLLATEEATAVLYPNPAPASASFLTLTLPTVLPNAVPITISDLTGRVVHTQLLPAGISNADLQLPATIPAGNYLLQVGGPAQPQKVIRWVRQ
uniref:T9SS type A sorting domain-containing protein n=1 Tax=Hymenobacter sp. AT01-02 TaxID=1571877 RepID=UPI0006E1439C